MSWEKTGTEHQTYLEDIFNPVALGATFFFYVPEQYIWETLTVSDHMVAGMEYEIWNINAASYLI